jgi:hypothetical protein
MIFANLYPQLFLVGKVIISTKTFTGLTTVSCCWIYFKV